MTAQNNTVTIIVPQNSGDVSISVSGMDSKGNFTANATGGTTDPTDLGSGWTSKSFKLKNNASQQATWTLTGDFTGLTISNASVKSIAVNHSTLKTLTASSINLTDITFTNAPVLETVNVSTNQLKEITKVPASVKTLNISGNQISDIKDLAIEGRTVTYGTQTVDKTSVSDIVANQWADLKSKLSITDLFPAEGGTYSYSFQKLSGSSTWGTANVRKNPSNANMYRFQSTTAYEHGTYKVSVTNNKVSGLTYVITFKVQPAQFKIEASTSNDKGNITTSAATNNIVENGKDYTLTATVTDNHYKFSKFETTGFKTPLASGSSITATVVGPTPSDNDDDQIVTVKAIFVPKTYKLTQQSVAEGGSFYVINAKGEKLDNNANVDYNSELTVVATANDKYELDKISINGTAVEDSKIETTNASGISKYKFTMTEATNIVVTFKAISETRELTADFPKDLVTITIADQNDKTVSVGENTNIKSDITLIKVNVKAKEDKKKEDIYVKDILLNGKSAENIRRKDDGYTVAEFTVTADTKNMDVTVVAHEKVAVTITPTKIGNTANQQTYTYDGTAKAFQYTTTPQGLTASVEYGEIPEGSSDASKFSSTAPTNAGNYQVKYKRDADTQYKAVATKENWKIFIEKAPLTLTAPTVTVKTTNGVRTYEISGGKAEANGKTIAGKFVANYSEKDEDGSLNVAANITGSHLVELVFVPTADADKKNYDYKNAKVSAECKIDGKEVAKYTIKGDLKDGISVTIKNGQAVLATWTSSNSTGIKVPTGAKITLEFTVPDGIKLKQVLDRAQGNKEIETFNNNILTLSGKTTDAIVDFILSTETVADEKSYTIEANKVPEKDVFVYDGSVKLIDTSNASKYYTVKENTPEYTATYVYKQNGKVVVSPINAGTYDVDVTITPKNSNSGYKATTKTIQMVIKKQTVYISAEPTASKIGKGQTLASSILTGGNATVPGKFEWADKTIVPVADKAYQVVFKPTDATNYDDGYAFKEATGVVTKNAVEIKVEISDQPVLSILTENGEITVKDANGKIYYTGDEIVKGTKLTFTATPAEGYELLSGIQVNGSTISGTYTVGDVSMTVTANFTIKPDTYIVTLGSAPKGSKIKSKPNSNVVTSGGSYTFSLSHLAGDNPTASVGAATYQGTTSGNTTTFTIPNIKSNISITISMTATPIKITTKPTLSKAGKPMGTIRVTGVNSSNECYYGDKITVTATANPGVDFAGWEGLTSTENPYEFEATNATYTFQAKYHGVLTGIESVDELNYYGGDGYIFVNCPAQGTLTIISMNGRTQKMSVSGQTRITVPAGVYGIVLTSGSEVVRDKVVVR